MRWLWLWAWLLAGSALAAEGQGPRRMAVLVGARSGALGRASLQFAHQDAEAVARTLKEVARFRAEDIQLLLEPSPREVLAALDRAQQAAAAEPQGVLLLFYYSGHADDASLYPSGQRLPFTELRQRLDAGNGALVRIGIIDACRGGGWTGAKGLSAAEPFEPRLPMNLESEGSILLASSSGQENAHEAEAIGGSIFTHHFVAGLRGAADGNADGEVSVAEVFAYARELTVRDSALLTSTPQHPSYHFNLRGREDLPLSRTAASPVTVSIRQTRGPLVILDRRSGRNVVELPAGQRQVQVALAPGRYLALRRADGQTHSLEFKLSSAERFALEESALVHSPNLASATKGFGPRSRHTLTLEPIFLPFGLIQLEFERAWTDFVSLYVGSAVWLPVTGPGWIAELDLGGRYYFFGEAPGGLFAAGQLGAISRIDRPGLQSLTATFSVQAGFSWLLWDRMVLSLAVGPQYWLPVRVATPLDPAKSSPEPPPFPILPRVRFVIGAAF